jgi:hypothetical protein
MVVSSSNIAQIIVAMRCSGAVVGVAVDSGYGLTVRVPGMVVIGVDICEVRMVT